jgi:predicted adenine nucleotide alpha hydrolase (AANH) superfamily ATPase
MQTINITAHTEDASQIEAIKAVIKAFKIKFSISKITDSAYDPNFVAMIKKGEKEIEEGKGIKMSIAEFKQLCK